MKYLFTLYADESYYANQSPEESLAEMAAYGKFGEEAEAAGIYLAGEGLQPTNTATTLRLRGGERVVTDGPFAETKEALGGFYLLDCKDLDDALEWGAKIPTATHGTVEIRPVMDYEAIGADANGTSAAAETA